MALTQEQINFYLLSGQYFHNKGEYKKALAVVATILKENNTQLEALYISASAYRNLADYKKAIAIIDYICSIDINYIPAYIQRAYILKNTEHFFTEVVLLKKIIFLIKLLWKNKKYNYYKYLSEVYSMLASAYTKIGGTRQACRYFLLSAKTEENPRQKIQEYSNAIFTTNYFTNNNKLSCHLYKNFQKFFQSIKTYDHNCQHLQQRLRIGYISPDFRCHPVIAWSLTLLTKYSNDKFEIHCFSSCKEDNTTLKLKKLPGLHWHNIYGLSSQESAAIIYDARINILFDFSGHTANNCLPVLAYKPAPIQICGIGYFNSTGLDTVDYFLSDIYCSPNIFSPYFTEQLLRLPHSHICYSPPDNVPDATAPPYLKNDYITFGCFNNFTKINHITLSMWHDILLQLPNSRLVLKNFIFNTTENRNHIKMRLIKANLPIERIEMRNFTINHLKDYHDIDIALDTYPYTGGVTSCEALYMGVPLITLSGDRHGSRFGCSILSNLRLKNLITYSPTEYVKKTISLAQNKNYLLHLHNTLCTIMKNSPLMDNTLYIKDIETVYKKIWQKYIDSHLYNQKNEQKKSR
ncbi:O-linked N-acetylglucosamine transferase, SPINDLY family protein [Pectinatus sottacetonis]|uniref:O-linked N-acetylglucosamine transferase, SPINDLY family protein n=1 Tax=Pectinatus sottacetonis TaxID=1002795 RepID=UPI0018C61CB6|nr:hypothetical protein [Pectinatus sottacetonis]